jgi:hypothetical protein
LTAYLYAELDRLPARPTDTEIVQHLACRNRMGGLAAAGLIIRLIIQTIRRDPSGSAWTDEALNVSRLDPSGADQIDAEHQATDLAVGGSNPSRRTCWFHRVIARPGHEGCAWRFSR